MPLLTDKRTLGKMNAPAIIGLIAVAIFLFVASCLYMCKKRVVEPLEVAEEN